MKKTLLLFIFFIIVCISNAQTIRITQLSAAEIQGGINVNLKTISFNGADYIGSTYTIDDNMISISACFSFDATLPVLQFNNDIFIPITTVSGSYIIEVNVYNSSLQSACDYYSLGDTGSITLLSGAEFVSKQTLVLTPNPTDGLLQWNKSLTKPVAIRVYDHSGRTIKELNDYIGDSLDLSNLNAGSYFINIESDNKNTIQKIVKK